LEAKKGPIIDARALYLRWKSQWSLMGRFSIMRGDDRQFEAVNQPSMPERGTYYPAAHS